MNEDKVRIIDINQTLGTEDSFFIGENADKGRYPRIFDLFKLAPEHDAKRVKHDEHIKKQIGEWMKKSRKNKAEPLISENEDFAEVYDFAELEDGGVLSYLLQVKDGKRIQYKEPFRGFPVGEAVNLMAMFKKIFQVMSNYYSSGILFKIGIGILFLSGILNKIVQIGVDFVHINTHRFLLKPNYYSQPIRELYRTMTVISNGNVFIDKVRNICCLILEFDNAYRYRWQDVLVELDKSALEKNFVKEIKRLLDILVSREIPNEKLNKPNHMKDKIEKLAKMLYLGVKYSKTFRNFIKEIALEINLDEVKPSQEDIYWFSFRDDYNFGGLDINKRKEWREGKYGKHE